MAGFREFQTGEVLTAANVNDFLSKQSVMKFADAAARNTALGTAVGGSNALREGMVAYLDDTDEVQYFDGSVWGPVGAEPPAGIGSNVVQTVKTDTFTTTSSSYVDITGLAVTITPTSASSKVLVICSVTFSESAATTNAVMRLVRDSTNIALGTGSSRNGTFYTGESFNSRDVDTASISFLDSPATTSATTYKLTVGDLVTGTFFLNRRANDTYSIVPSVITAIEVEA